MALLMFEGFDNLRSTTNAAGQDLVSAVQTVGWGPAATASVLRVAGQLGGFAISTNATTQNPVFTPGSNYSTLIFGGRFRTPTVNLFSGDILRFYDGSSVQCGLQYNVTANKLVFFRGTNSTVIATSTTALAAGALWFFIELKVTFGNAAAWELRINGVTEMSGTTDDTTNTANNTASAIWLSGAQGSGDNTCWDDVYLLDGTGSAPYNDFLGPIRVETLPASANDSVTWTPNASTNVSRVSDTAHDSDTTYNSTASAGNVDLFTHSSLSSNPATIYAVQACARMRKEDVINKTARTKLVSGGTTQNGTTRALATSYGIVSDIYTADPNTAAAWTASGVNNSKIGYELVA